MTSGPSLKIDGKVYPMPDVATMTLGEICDLEAFSGHTIGEFTGLLERGSTTAIVAMAAVVMRRTDKSITLEQVRAYQFNLLSVEAPDSGQEAAPDDPPTDGAAAYVSQNGSSAPILEFSGAQ